MKGKIKVLLTVLFFYKGVGGGRKKINNSCSKVMGKNFGLSENVKRRRKCEPPSNPPPPQLFLSHPFILSLTVVNYRIDSLYNLLLLLRQLTKRFVFHILIYDCAVLG